MDREWWHEMLMDAAAIIVLAILLGLMFWSAGALSDAWGGMKPTPAESGPGQAPAAWVALVAARDMGALGAGDIVAVRPAGSPWGKKERDGNNFGMVIIMNMTPFQAEALCSPEKDAAGRVIRERRYAFSHPARGARVDGSGLVFGDKKLQRLVSASEAAAGREGN